MALNFTIAILLFGAGGWFLDGWVHTRPLFTIIGAFLGGFAGFMSIYYKVKKETAKGGEGEAWPFSAGFGGGWVLSPHFLWWKPRRSPGRSHTSRQRWWRRRPNP